MTFLPRTEAPPYRRDLRKHFWAVASGTDHLADAAHMPLDAGQSRDHLVPVTVRVLVRRAVFVAVRVLRIPLGRIGHSSVPSSADILSPRRGCPQPV